MTGTGDPDELLDEAEGALHHATLGLIDVSSVLAEVARRLAQAHQALESIGADMDPGVDGWREERRREYVDLCQAMAEAVATLRRAASR